MRELDWHGCYTESAKNLITPESFAHPAKMSVALCKRIFNFMEGEGMIRRGDVVLDPFGGIGMTGIVGASMGYQVISVELEEKFVKLNQANVEKHRKAWMQIGLPVPVVLQGDSRKLAQIIQKVDVAMMSPPFSPAGRQVSARHQGHRKNYPAMNKKLEDNYGDTLGQIRKMKESDINGIILSPPFNEDVHNANYNKDKDVRGRDAKRRAKQDYIAPQDPANIGITSIDDLSAIIISPPYAEIRMDGGNRVGQDSMKPYSGEVNDAWRTTRDQTNIGNLKEDNPDAIITSPPWEKGIAGNEGISEKLTTRSNGKNMGLGASSDSRYGKQIAGKEYLDMSKRKRNELGHFSKAGSEEVYDQIGNLEKETYWQAMALVYSQCCQALKADGWMAIVVKDFIRDKRRVSLCDNTAKLLEHLGFKLEYRIRAWLVEHSGTEDAFTGKIKVKSRKSFFRRLAENKGSPKIDFEEVIIIQKPTSRKERTVA